MKTEIKIKKEVEISTLIVDAGVRYWEDATVNGVEDTTGTLIPCRVGDRWQISIDIETGIITNWPKGVTAKTHYKVCNDGIYKLADKDGNVLLTKEGYVPNILEVSRDSYGDYLILNIGDNGKISNWNNNPDIQDFFDDED